MLQSGVRHGSLDLVLAFPTMIRIAVVEDRQYLVWPCSGRRTACCQVGRDSILFYLYQSILVVGIDGKDGDRLAGNIHGGSWEGADVTRSRLGRTRPSATCPLQSGTSDLICRS